MGGLPLIVVVVAVIVAVVVVDALMLWWWLWLSWECQVSRDEEINHRSCAGENNFTSRLSPPSTNHMICGDFLFCLSLPAQPPPPPQHQPHQQQLQQPQ